MSQDIPGTQLGVDPEAPDDDRVAGRGPSAGRPKRWKLWLLVVVTLYPVITTAVTLAEPALAGVPTYLRFAVIVPVMVTIMLYLVVPLLQRAFGQWMLR